MVCLIRRHTGAWRRIKQAADLFRTIIRGMSVFLSGEKQELTQ